MKKSFILLFVIIFSCSVYSVGPRKSHNTQYTEDDAATIIGDVRGDLNGAWDSMIHQLRAAEQNTPNDRECKGNIFRQFVGNMMRIFREFTTAQPAFPAENLAALLLDPMFFKVENEVLQNIFQQFGLLRRFDYHQYISFLDFLMIFATEADREFFLSLLNDTLLSVHENCNTLNLIHPTSKTPPIVFFAIVWLEVLQVDGAQINTRGYSVIYPGLRLTLQMPLYRKKHYNSNEELYHENLSLLSIFIAQYLKAIVASGEDKSLIKDWLKKIKQLLHYAGPLREHNLRAVLDGFADCRGFHRLKLGEYIPSFHELIKCLRAHDPSMTLEELLGCEDHLLVAQELLHQPLQFHTMPQLVEIEMTPVETDPNEILYQNARPTLLRFLRSTYRSIRDGLKTVHLSKN